jgi:uncharacterized protein
MARVGTDQPPSPAASVCRRSRGSVQFVSGEGRIRDFGNSVVRARLPVARDGLLEQGATAREYTMRFVRVPGLTAEPAWQRYEPLGNRAVRYRSIGYQADIAFDADGFVTLYQDYLERVG